MDPKQAGYNVTLGLVWPRSSHHLIFYFDFEAAATSIHPSIWALAELVVQSMLHYNYYLPLYTFMAARFHYAAATAAADSQVEVQLVGQVRYDEQEVKKTSKCRSFK